MFFLFADDTNIYYDSKDLICSAYLGYGQAYIYNTLCKFSLLIAYIAYIAFKYVLPTTAEYYYRIKRYLIHTYIHTQKSVTHPNSTATFHASVEQ